MKVFKYAMEIMDHLIAKLDQSIISWTIEHATAPAHPTCTWTEDADGYYSTECGEAYVFNDGTPAYNNAYFCHHCGGTIVMGVPL